MALTQVRARARGLCLRSNRTAVVVAASCAALLLAALPSRARAETLLAPVGGHAIRLAPGRVVCAEGAELHGWAVDPDARGVRPPASAEGVGQAVVLRTAPDPARCAAATSAGALTLVAVSATAPAVDRASVVADVDAGTVTVRGRGLRGMVMRWTAGTRGAGTDTCLDPQPVAGSAGIETCALAIARGLPADPTALALAFFPAGARTGGDTTWYDAQGQPAAAPPGDAAPPARVVVARVVPPEASLDVQSGEARVALVHPEALAGVDCAEASCALDGSDLVIRDARGAGDALEVRLRLRPHVFVARGAGGGGALDPAPVATIPVRRCPVAVASAAPLRGVADQRVVVRVGGQCARDASLAVASNAGAARVEGSETVGDARYLVVGLDRASVDELDVTVLHGGTVVGVARARTRAPPTVHARLEIPGRGAIDFIPTNRPARVLLPAGTHGAMLEPLPVEDVYTVAHDAAGRDVVQAVEGAAGAVALRLAYRDRSLPAPLRGLDLATLVEPVDRAIHAANLPVPLGESALGPRPLVELICGDGRGHPRRIAPGVTASLPYRARDTCRVVLHRERLRADDGAQALHLTVTVIGVDGAERADARVDQRVVLQPGEAPRYLYVTGVDAPFDRVIVRASLDVSGGHYAITPDENAVAPQVQWSVILGDDRFRIYATTAIPTGLFRVAAGQGTNGILTLNAGALMRLVWLSREGRESPIGLEAGVMWVGIAGDAAAVSAQGQVALVAGIGIGVPIANPSRVSQTSINLHLWLEYEVSRAFQRAVPGGPAPGTPLGVVFGPSISIGDLGVNF